MFSANPIGHVSSALTDPSLAPKQSHEGAPSAWLEFAPEMAPALRDLSPGAEVLLLTWLDRADRTALEVHPRDDATAPLRGVFSTRSADRPNPIGVHRVTVVEVASPTRIRVDALEAIDGTPILDVKPADDGRSILYARSVFFVADAARALRFYTEELGFTLDWDSHDGVFQVSLFGFELILNEVHDRTIGRAGHGRLFIGLENNQGELLRAHVAEKGIQGQRVEWGRPTFVIRDLDGNELFFWVPGDDVDTVVDAAMG